MSDQPSAQGETMGYISDAQYRENMSNAYHASRMVMANRLLRKADGLVGQEAFDFGCGDGSLMREMEKLGARVSGCDVSATLVAYHENAEIGGVEKLRSLETDAFQLMACMNVLAYVPDSDGEAFYSETLRVLKPGGYLLMAQGNSRLVNADRYNVEGLADPEQYSSQMKRRGFDLVATEWTNCLLPKPVRLLLGRSRKTVNPTVIDLLPESYRRNRCSAYFALFRKN